MGPKFRGTLSSCTLAFVLIWSPTLRELVELAESAPDDGLDVLGSVYTWEHERLMAVAKGPLGAIVALLVAVIGAALSGNLTTTTTQVVVFAVSIAVLFIVGMVALFYVTRVNTEYVRSVQAFSDLR
jgi:hypothetical protein